MKHCFFFIVVCFTLVCNSFAQSNFKKDNQLLCSKSDRATSDTLNTKKIMKIDHFHTLNKINPIYGALKLSMFFYQKIVSPQISSGCVFEQSCSNYSKSAIKRFGIVKGVLLTADRLSRCTPGTYNETEPFLFNDEGKVIDNPEFYSFKKKK